MHGFRIHHTTRVRPVAAVLVPAAVALAALLLAFAGCGGDNPTKPGRGPITFNIPTEISLQDAAAAAQPGDTLLVLFSPFPLTETVSFSSDQTPLIIMGNKDRPSLSIAVSDLPILHFESPKAGTRVVQMGFSGGYAAVDAAGSGAISVENCRFSGGEVQVYGTGSGLRMDVTGCIMTGAGLFSIEMGPGSTVTATDNTLDGAGDCGIFLTNTAATVYRCIIWRSANYGIACNGSSSLASGSGCNDIHMSGVSPYLGCTEQDKDLHEDPLFCDPDNGDYTLDYNSPCVPNLSGCDDFIGALGVGCGTGL